MNSYEGRFVFQMQEMRNHPEMIIRANLHGYVLDL
jgi:hypothetical protein